MVFFTIYSIKIYDLQKILMYSYKQIKMPKPDTSEFVLNWGVVGLGNFAASYLNDVFKNYKKDPLYNKQFQHNLKAVASTTSIEKAKSFLTLLDDGIKGNTKAYGSYEELLNDETINIVYIAAPNAFHYSLALKALDSGKHIIVEKTFTINEKQAVKLKRIGKEKNLFILEGLWTRFLPTFKAISKLVLEEEIIGKICKLSADLSHDCDIKAREDKFGRLFNTELGGGVLYDNIIYSITWVDKFLLSQTRKLPKITSSSILNGNGDEYQSVDTSTIINLTFQDLNAIGIASGSFEVESIKDSVIIEGKKGYLKINSTSRPTIVTLYKNDDEIVIDLPKIEGIGYYFEANATALAIKNGFLETSEHKFESIVRIQHIFDIVKQQNNIKFPEYIENV